MFANKSRTAAGNLASHAVVFREARLYTVIFVGKDERRAPLKTPEWEATGNRA